MTKLLVTYEDGSRETVDVDLREAAVFGADPAAFHGRVVEARIAPTVPADLDPEGFGFPNHTRLSRSLTIHPTMRSGVPIYGTGRDR